MIMPRLFFAASVVAVLTVPLAVQGETITLEAVQDVRCPAYENGGTACRTQNFDGQGVWVGKITTTPRWYDFSIFQFDLSSLPGPVTSARVELYDLGTSNWQGTKCDIDLYLVSPKEGLTDEELIVAGTGGNAFDGDGTHEEYMTYSAYGAAANVKWMESSTVMDLDLAAGNGGDQYYASTNADSGLLDVLNANRTGKGYAVVLAYYVNSGEFRKFDDREGGHAPRLVVDAIPEPATLVLLAGLGFALACTRIRW